jgi:hypothetical protein
VGAKLDGVGLYTEWWDAEHGKGAWLGPDTITTDLFGPLRADGVLDRATHLSVDGGDPIAIESPDHLDELARGWRDVSVAMFTGDQRDPEWYFHLALLGWQLRISVSVGARWLTADTRDQLGRWVLRWAEPLAGRGCHLSIGTLIPPWASYPRPRPPRTSMRWPLGALDHYFGRTWHRGTPEGAAVIAAVEQAALPPGATRTVDGDVVRVAFAADLGDPASVVAARARAEQWLVPLVPSEVERGWNEHGDRLVVVVRPVDLSPFTVYDERHQVGYKALILDNATGDIAEPELWQELAAIARAGKTADGVPVRGVRLVFPVRGNAVQMHARALADGFEMATYPGGNGFWQVNPP